MCSSAPETPAAQSSFSELEQSVLARFFELANAQTPAEKKRAFSQFFGCTFAFASTGGTSTPEDEVGMLSEDYLVKIGLRPRPASY